jgi:hypothetical protein
LAYGELAAQARTGRFSSLRARKLWLAIGRCAPVTDLAQQVAKFAEDIQQLLNGTVCDGLTVRATVSDSTRMLVGEGLPLFGLSA